MASMQNEKCKMENEKLLSGDDSAPFVAIGMMTMQNANCKMKNAKLRNFKPTGTFEFKILDFFRISDLEIRI